jgi:hypothetical protein
MRDRIPKKGFKITIYGVADYDTLGEGTLNFAETVNAFMQTCLHDLQEELNDKEFANKSSFKNCEIMGHSNKEYPANIF